MLSRWSLSVRCLLNCFAAFADAMPRPNLTNLQSVTEEKLLPSMSAAMITYHHLSVRLVDTGMLINVGEFMGCPAMKWMNRCVIW